MQSARQAYRVLMKQPQMTKRTRLQGIARRAMVEHSLTPDFAADAVAQTMRIAQPASEAGPSIRDLRALLWASIDNDDSRDLDQLSVSAPAEGDSVTISVAVADVDALVELGSAIDAHAAGNTTSVYTAAEVFPMLPEKLSTDLTSLGQGQDRLAIVTEMTFAGDGALVRSDVYRALVRNHAKLAYNAVAAWLDGTAPMPAAASQVEGLDHQLRVQEAVAQRLRALRHQHGALTLETIEPRAIFDGDDLVDMKADEKNRAKVLIEEFMVAANGVNARYLAAHGLPSLRRVLRSPERWERIVAIASGLNEQLPAQPDGVALEAFLRRRQGADPARFPDLSLSVVKLLGRGEYVVTTPEVTAPSHFGLAVSDYAHSTAPNRRFPDLVTQRLLKAALASTPPPYSLEALGRIAQRCTEREDSASKVERQVRKSAAAMMLEHREGEQFDGVVTGASTKGTWARIAHPAVEGKVVRGATGLDVGDHVRLSLLKTDVERGFIDFGRVGPQ